MSNIRKFKNTKKKTVIQILIGLIEDCMKTFTESDSYKTQYLGNQRGGEDTLTNALRDHLDENSRIMNSGIFKFTTQAEQADSKSGKGKKRTVDMAVSTTQSKGYYIFCIEAKWINADDYITKNQGGIKRFKTDEHGLCSSNPDNSYLLDENGIFAYIKTQKTPEDYLQQLNDKIKSLSKDFHTENDEFGLNWSKSELLVKKYEAQEDKYISKHPRISGSEVKLHHFWCYVN